VPRETWGEIGIAFVVPDRSALIGAQELTAFLASRLAKFKIPREFVFLDNLPRTPYGKVVKADLHQQYVSSGAAHGAPQR